MNNTNSSTKNFAFTKIEGYTLFLVAYTASITSTSMTASSALVINASDVTNLYMLMSGIVASQWNIDAGQVVVVSHGTVTITIVALG